MSKRRTMLKLTKQIFTLKREIKWLVYRASLFLQARQTIQLLTYSLVLVWYYFRIIHCLLVMARIADKQLAEVIFQHELPTCFSYLIDLSQLCVELFCFNLLLKPSVIIWVYQKEGRVIYNLERVLSTLSILIQINLQFITYSEEGGFSEKGDYHDILTASWCFYSVFFADLVKHLNASPYPLHKRVQKLLKSISKSWQHLYVFYLKCRHSH